MHFMSIGMLHHTCISERFDKAFINLVNAENDLKGTFSPQNGHLHLIAVSQSSDIPCVKLREA